MGYDIIYTVNQLMFAPVMFTVNTETHIVALCWSYWACQTLALLFNAVMGRHAAKRWVSFAAVLIIGLSGTLFGFTMAAGVRNGLSQAQQAIRGLVLSISIAGDFKMADYYFFFANDDKKRAFGKVVYYALGTLQGLALAAAIVLTIIFKTYRRRSVPGSVAKLIGLEPDASELLSDRRGISYYEDDEGLVDFAHFKEEEVEAEEDGEEELW